MSINNVKKINFKFVKDPRGDLIEVDFLRDIPFIPKRVFLVKDVPTEKVRGEHAHKKCHQLLVCVKGSVSVVVDDGILKKEFILNNISEGLYLPPMIWGIQYNYSSDSVLMVYASHEYNNDDYIRNYDKYLVAINNEKK